MDYEQLLVRQPSGALARSDGTEESNRSAEEDGQNASERSHLLPSGDAQTGLGRYASKELLKEYIPELDPTHPRAITLRVKMAKRSTMLAIQLGSAVVVVILNASLMIWLLITYQVDYRGIGTFTFGDCSNINLINSSLHVALNIVSSLFLASGNYCMQILVAPSRAEIDKADAKGCSLEIGVPSVKNLRYIQRSRIVLWILIGILSTLLHLFWNSALFTSIPVVAVPRAIATSDFLTAAENWTISDPLGHRSWWHFAPGYGEASHNVSLIYNLQEMAPTMERLDTAACIERFINPLTVSTSVIVVAQNMTSQQFNGSSLLDGWVSGWETWTLSATWICDAYQSSDLNHWRLCDSNWAKEFSNDWHLRWHDIWRIKVDHCLAGGNGDNEKRCGLHYSAYIWEIVCACTSLECLLVFVVWLRNRRDMKVDRGNKKHRTMVTIGDAIHSFLEYPDAANISEESGHGATTPTKGGGSIILKKARWVVSKRVSWLQAASMTVWILSYICFLGGLSIPAASVGSSLNHLKKIGVDVSLQGIWNQKFKVNPAATTSDLGPFGNVSQPTLIAFLGNVLVANSPQLLMSVLYLFYNSILTRQLIADEWLRFLKKSGKKTLRVSSPIGMQRSSYFLSLPLKYSIPLLASTTTLHWLISQSMFLVQSSGFGPGEGGGRLPEYDNTLRGYSALGSLLAIMLAIVLIFAIGINAALRSYKDVPPGFVRMGHNSSALKALCRRPIGDGDAHLFPISLGMVETQEPGCQGRMAFTTDIRLNQDPDPEKTYLLPVLAPSENKLLLYPIYGKGGRQGWPV
ncbi:hypothetical protein PG984_015467 [Apiospora sp. TS-2023a]